MYRCDLVDETCTTTLMDKWKKKNKRRKKKIDYSRDASNLNI